ncbi:MAG TPA: hypothetical protein VN798_11960 [Pseudomonas sp.]|nr:hypothetical protein [Pseudomonas sp.]
MKRTTHSDESALQHPRGSIPTPSIPQADPVDGLLTLEQLAQPVGMVFAAWQEAVPGHSYQLVLNGLLIGEKKYIGNEKPGDPLTLEIPPSLLAVDGTHRVGYAAINEVGGQIAYSPDIPLIVDRTAPGGDLLAPLIFDPRLLPLTEASLTTAGNSLTARLPSYFDAKWGDIVRTYWGDQPGPQRTLVAEELGGSEISFSFERSFLEQLNDGDIAVTYTISDRAGNLSIVSEPAVLRLQLRDHPQDLRAPVVPRATDGMIEHNDARHGVQVQIPHYGNAQPGDVIVLSWGGLALPGQVLDEHATAQSSVLSMTVSFATLQAAGDGPIEVRYEVRRDGLAPTSSPATTVNVFVSLPGPQDPMPETLINEHLAAPRVRGKAEHATPLINFLDPDDYLLDADTVIPWQTGFKACDQIQVYWGSWPIPVVRTLDQNDIDAGLDLVLCVPNKVISGEGVGRAIPVRYQVTHAGNPNTSHSSTQPVRVVCRALLPGGECGLPGAVFVDVDASQTLRLPVIAQGTSLLIKPYRNMRPGDQIQLSLTGFDAFVDGKVLETAALNLSTTVSEEAITSDIIFKVPANIVEQFSIGVIQAKYRIENDYGAAESLLSAAYIDRRIPQPLCAS